MGVIYHIVLMTISASVVSWWGVAARCNTPYCTQPWRAFHGQCYQFLDLHKSWNDAEKYCQMLSNPGKMVHLASIHCKEEDEFIGKLVMSSRSTDVGEDFWIGYHDHGREGVFQWTYGTNASHSNWAPGEPNNFPEKENCVEKYTQYANRKWNDLSCNMKLSFVCKM